MVTGGAGFIGCNVAKSYLDEGACLIVVDDLSRRGSELNLKWLRGQGKFDFLHVDLRNYDRLVAIFKEHPDIDLVFHMAAQAAVTTSVRDPRCDFDTNLLGTFNLLEAIRQANCKPILIHASTNKVYGPLEDIVVVEKERRYEYLDSADGISEERQLDFYSPYGCSKGAAEQYVRDYTRNYGIKAVVFRQSCIYGPRQLGSEEQGWIAWFVIAGLLGRPITIYGNGKQVRDVLFIDDLLEAYRKAIAHIDRASGEVFNMGGGRVNQISLLELLDLLEEYLGRRIHVTFCDWRPGDQKIFLSDISKAKRDLEWKPKTGFRTGIKTLIQCMTDENLLGQIAQGE